MKISQVSLDSVYQFYEIARHESLQKAAKTLNISSPALSHSLKKLEDCLGVSLCFRGKSGFRLTNEGQELLKRFEPFVDEFFDYLQSLNDPEKYSGILKIGMLDNLNNKKFDSIFKAINKTFPQIKISLLILNSDEITKMLKSSELDIGFGIFHEKDSELKYFKIGESTMKYFISENHPLWRKKKITKQDLKGHKVTWFDSDKRDLKSIQSQVFGDHPNYLMEVGAFTNNTDGAIQLLKTGQLVVPLPPDIVKSKVLDTRVKPLNLKTNAPKFAESAAIKSNKFYSTPMKKIIQLLDAR